MMKIAVLVGLLFLLPAPAAAQCGLGLTGQKVVGPPSPAKIRVVANLGGRPTEGARVDVYTVYGNSRRLIKSLVTGADGAAVPATLSPGNYSIHVWRMANGWLADSEMALYVLRGGKTDPCTYVTMLTHGSTVPRAREALATPVPEKSLLGIPLKEFSGVIRDPSAAPIPGAAIEVWKIENGNQSPAGQATGGSDGKFRLALADGAYVATFKEQGFHRKVLVFTIDSNESTESDGAPIVVSLAIGCCS